jgi:hypothetical protein
MKRSVTLATDFTDSTNHSRWNPWNPWLIVFAVSLFAVCAFADNPRSNCATCHAKLSERLAKPVARSRLSAHQLSDIGCADCHGGDPSAPRGGKLHASFPGHPAPKEVADFCGRCHKPAWAEYSKSGHALMRGVKPAVSCVDCHGSHDVGNPPELFRLGEYCGSCHGLEYLPLLPAGFLKLMGASDQLTDILRRRLPVAEAKPVQRRVGTLVHRGSLAIPAAEVQDLLQEIERVSARVRLQK